MRERRQRRRRPPANGQAAVCQIPQDGGGQFLLRWAECGVWVTSSQKIKVVFGVLGLAVYDDLVANLLEADATR